MLRHVGDVAEEVINEMVNAQYLAIFEPDFTEAPWSQEWATDPNGETRAKLATDLRFLLQSLGLVDDDLVPVGDRFVQTLKAICAKEGFEFANSLPEQSLFKWSVSYLPVSTLQVMARKYQQLKNKKGEQQ